MLSYVAIVKLLLTIVDKIAGAMSDKQLLDAGADRELAKTLTRISERVMRKKEDDALVDTFDDQHLADELRKHTRPANGNERLLPTSNNNHGVRK